jgi:glutamine synthetase
MHEMTPQERIDARIALMVRFAHDERRDFVAFCNRSIAQKCRRYLEEIEITNQLNMLEFYLLENGGCNEHHD